MLSLGEINKAMSGLKDWNLESNSISKNFSFSNFKESLDFVNKVATLADKQDHHPDVMLSCDQVRLSLTTRSEKGLTQKDFELAKEIDQL